MKKKIIIRDICCTESVIFNYSYVNTTDEKMQADLLHVMSALSMMQQPTYFRMKPHVNATKHILPLLKSINLTDFMLTVRNKLIGMDQKIKFN